MVIFREKKIGVGSRGDFVFGFCSMFGGFLLVVIINFGFNRVICYLSGEGAGFRFLVFVIFIFLFFVFLGVFLWKVRK